MSQMRRIGQFEVQELLGEGGIGQVYAARDTVLDRMVAIKSLRAELLSDKSFVERFRAEARNLALLSHPNITTLYTLLEEGGSLYMVMEMVRGRTLETILDERGAPFTTEEALAIVAQAADGLSYAHEMGIVHRDIKPANLILTNTGLLKIMDFGIARAQGTQRMTRDGSIVGTLAYMSPEQCRGQDVDGRTDQYSLAIVLYEMLTGKVPFEAATDYELMQAHINSPPEWPSRRVSGVPAHAEKALMKALSKKAPDRYPTMTAFKDALGAPTSRTEALSIVHKVTRLAGSAGISSSFPAITSAMSNVTDSMKKSSVPFAVKGIAAGGGLALVLAAGLLYLLSPRPVVQSNLVVTKVSNDGAPVQVIPRPQDNSRTQDNPYFVDQRHPAAAPPDTHQSSSSLASRPGSGGRSPFEVAAEPQIPGPAAGNQPSGPASPASGTAPRPHVTPPANNPPPQNSANASTPNAASDAAGANPGPAPDKSDTTSDTTPQKTASTDTPDSASKADHGQTDGRKTPDKDALAAYEAKNYTGAREIAEPCAKDGNPDCQFIMGRLVEAKDPGAAADWYRKAADNGSAKARYNLGALYYSGQGVPKDTRVAAEWFSKAAYQNHAGAQFNLAYLYETGDGVPKNLAEARKWYTEVAEKATDKQLAADAQEALDRLGGKHKH
jgi:eukaryotic-like serine/threonine-protein kinase